MVTLSLAEEDDGGMAAPAENEEPEVLHANQSNASDEHVDNDTSEDYQ